MHEGKEYRACLQSEGCTASLHSKCVLIATGADYRRIDAEGREDFEGSGVYYAATALEGQLCRGATVIVAGAGNSAGQAAMYLSEGAAKVLLVVRGKDLSKSMSNYLSRRVQTKKNIEILYAHRDPKNARRQDARSQSSSRTRKPAERWTVETPAVFSMIGAMPCTNWLPPEIECDAKGFIKTGTAVADAPAWKRASALRVHWKPAVPGIFAAGDVRSGSVKRCAAAVGEGGMASCRRARRDGRVCLTTDEPLRPSGSRTEF